MVRQRFEQLLVTWLVPLRMVVRLLVSCARHRLRVRKPRHTARLPRLRALCAGRNPRYSKLRLRLKRLHLLLARLRCSLPQLGVARRVW